MFNFDQRHTAYADDFVFFAVDVKAKRQGAVDFANDEHTGLTGQGGSAATAGTLHQHCTLEHAPVSWTNTAILCTGLAKLTLLVATLPALSELHASQVCRVCRQQMITFSSAGRASLHCSRTAGRGLPTRASSFCATLSMRELAARAPADAGLWPASAQRSQGDLSTRLQVACDIRQPKEFGNATWPEPAAGELPR